MKKKIIIVLVLSIGVCLGIFGINKFKPLTEEEKMEISRQVDANLNENIRYKFAQIISIDGSQIEVKYFETPQGYGDKGYNDNLDIDISQLKSSGEEEKIEIIGVAVNFVLAELKVDDYVRVGTYQPRVEDKLTEFEMNQILWVEVLNVYE